MDKRPPRRRVIGPRFDGARELDRFLRTTGLSAPRFAEGHKLDRHLLERLLRGDARWSPGIDFILDVQKATEGRVVPDMWREETLRPDEPGDVTAAVAGDSATDLGAETDDDEIDSTGTDGPS